MQQIESVVEAERLAPAILVKIEAISGDVVTSIQQIFQHVAKREVI